MKFHWLTESIKISVSKYFFSAEISNVNELLDILANGMSKRKEGYNEREWRGVVEARKKGR